MNPVEQKDRQTLRRCRAEKKELRRLCDEAQAHGVGSFYKGQALDGMPHGQGGGGLDVKICKWDRWRQMIKKEERICRETETAARAVLDKINPEPGLYAFCLWYYIQALDVDEVLEVCRIGRRQAQRYMRRIDRNE